MKSCFIVLFVLILRVGAYNPLDTQKSGLLAPIDLEFPSSTTARSIPVRLYLTDSTQPVILFSHGLGGSRKNNSYLAKHWQARGFHCVFIQHPGSDESVWQSVPLLQRLRAMKKAANFQNATLRIQDVNDVLVHLEQLNQSEDSRFANLLMLEKTGMSGHSFGAVTTQSVSGQKTLGGLIQTRIERIRAALLLSPSTPKGGSAERCFGSVDIPWMLMTGTLDTAIIGGADVASRLAVYDALPPKQKYQVVFHEAEHSAFSDRALPGDTKPRNPNHHRVIIAFSTAFFEGTLKRNPQALAWLKSDEARAMLEPKDRYDWK